MEADRKAARAEAEGIWRTSWERRKADFVRRTCDGSAMHGLAHPSQVRCGRCIPFRLELRTFHPSSASNLATAASECFNVELSAYMALFRVEVASV